ncbi:unnamed protein product [Durusdinium trenchii]|uniref:BZIP domain-containing protein n=1 Tax=Durusdinium trenchii TaxID=1381693 RepID=A0ABP0I4S3_9DINO
MAAAQKSGGRRKYLDIEVPNHADRKNRRAALQRVYESQRKGKRKRQHVPASSQSAASTNAGVAPITDTADRFTVLESLTHENYKLRNENDALCRKLRCTSASLKEAEHEILKLKEKLGSKAFPLSRALQCR